MMIPTIATATSTLDLMCSDCMALAIIIEMSATVGGFRK
jgi:hypothetical protein